MECTAGTQHSANSASDLMVAGAGAAAWLLPQCMAHESSCARTQRLTKAQLDRQAVLHLRMRQHPLQGCRVEERWDGSAVQAAGSTCSVCRCPRLAFAACMQRMPMYRSTPSHGHSHFHPWHMPAPTRAWAELPGLAGCVAQGGQRGGMAGHPWQHVCCCSMHSR